MSDEMPSGWVETTLGAVVDKPRPKAAPTSQPDLRFVGMDHIAANGMELLTTAKFGDMKSNGGRFFEGDVLYGRMRPYLNKVYRARFDGACSAEFIVFPKCDAIDGDFLAYQLHSRPFVNFATSLSSGDRPRVDVADISAYRFRLPPIREQRRIASKIDELFSRIGEGERALERLQQLVKLYRQSVLKAAVTGELTREWREENQNNGESGEALLDRILKARREAWEKRERRSLSAKGLDDSGKLDYREPAPAGSVALPMLPRGWAWASMGQLLVAIEAGRSFKCEERAPNGSEFGVVKVSAVTWGVYDERESKTITDPARVQSAYLIKRGDFLFSRANTIELVGACVIAGEPKLNLLLSDKILRFVFAIDLKKWIDLVLKSSIGRSQIEALASGNQHSMRNIGRDRIERILVPIPPSGEMDAICDIVSKANLQTQLAIDAVLSEQRRATAARQAILNTAFAGRLVSQEPTEEPASALLARIAAERASAKAPPRPTRRKKSTR